MKHIAIIRERNLRDYGIFCDIDLTSKDVALIVAGKRLIDQADESLFVSLSNGAKAKISLMPDTNFPIVKAV